MDNKKKKQRIPLFPSLNSSVDKAKHQSLLTELILILNKNFILN
jgi:hypothetical protein